MRVYIAGPISLGDLRDNIEQANVAFFELARVGFAPFCPQWSCFGGEMIATQEGYYSKAEHMPRGTNWDFWIDLDLPWVEVSDAVLRLPGESKGADAEVAHAQKNGIPVFTNIDDLLNWRETLA